MENLHWIDQTSEEFLGTLVESLPGAPILLLTTYRPGYRPPWIEKSYATQLALRPLSPQDSLQIVQGIFENTPAITVQVEAILRKAEGNPFFLEELARAVGERGDLRAPARCRNPSRGPGRSPPAGATLLSVELPLLVLG